MRPQAFVLFTNKAHRLTPPAAVYSTSPYSELDSDISGRPSSKLDSDPLIPHGNVYIYISIKCGEGIQMTAPN